MGCIPWYIVREERERIGVAGGAKRLIPFGDFKACLTGQNISNTGETITASAMRSNPHARVGDIGDVPPSAKAARRSYTTCRMHARGDDACIVVVARFCAIRF